jgi:hypothetical protein
MFSPIWATASLTVSATDLPVEATVAALKRLQSEPSVESATDCDRAGQILESVVAGDEVGLGIDFDHHGGIALRRDRDQAFGGGAAGFLVSLGNALGAQPVNSGFHVATGFGQCLLAIHHACAGLVAQLFHHCSGNAHNSLFILRAPGPALRRLGALESPSTACSTCH